MSVKVISAGVYRVLCSSCDADGIVRGGSSWEALQNAARHGWDTSGRLDRCKRCAAAAERKPAKRGRR